MPNEPQMTAAAPGTTFMMMQPPPALRVKPLVYETDPDLIPDAPEGFKCEITVKNVEERETINRTDGSIRTALWAEYETKGAWDDAKPNRIPARVAAMLAYLPSNDPDDVACNSARARAKEFAKALRQYMANTEIPPGHTSLDAWPSVTGAQKIALRSLGMRSVEDVRDAPSAMASKLGFAGGQALPQLAQVFLDRLNKNYAGKIAAESADHNAATQAKVAEQAELIASMKAQSDRQDAMMAQMAAMLADLRRKLGEDDEPAEAKPARGRPPKAAAEAA